jgi:predicted nucleic acid-binding protein
VNAVFIDTSGWTACADAADPAHSRCCEVRDSALEAGRTLVTTDFVVHETLTLLRMRLGLDAAERWWKQVDGSARFGGSASIVTDSRKRDCYSSSTGPKTSRLLIARALS